MKWLFLLLAVSGLVLAVHLGSKEVAVILANVKSTVRFQVVTAEMQRVVEVVSEVWAAYGATTPTITSANDSTHMAGSKHYVNQALDFRTHDLPVAQKGLMFGRVKQVLGRDYDVIFEYEGKPEEHLHIEFDPKSSAA